MTDRDGHQQPGHGPTGPGAMFRNVLLAMATLLFTGESSTAAPLSDLTIEVGGDLLTYGGVVTIYDIPVSQEAWPTGIGETPTKIRLDSRYAEVQLRYPRGGKFVFRFRPAEGTSDPETFATQVLSVIGTDEKHQGPQMTEGFKDAYSSCGQIIRMLPFKERAGDAEATRTAGRWGETQLYDDPPPADQRSARGLIAVIRDGQKQPHLLCKGDELAQACTIADEQWPALNALWWRAIAEQRLERLRDRALRRCYDSSFFGGGTCEPDPESDEPAYLYKNKK